MALLEVDSNIDTEYVIERADKSVDLDNATCIISGWGYTSKYNKNNLKKKRYSAAFQLWDLFL